MQYAFLVCIILERHIPVKYEQLFEIENNSVQHLAVSD